MAETRRTQIDLLAGDPPPTTAFEFAGESGLLRLRRYVPAEPLAGVPPLLLVYPVIKRPFLLDLLPRRSVVRSLLAHGLTVYLTDWRAPETADSERGFDDYVGEDLAYAVDRIRVLEDAESVSLVGCCCAAVFCAIQAALEPRSVARLVTYAGPFALDPPVPESVARQIIDVNGNVPAGLIAWSMNCRMWTPWQMALQLTRDLGEPEIARGMFDEPSPLLVAFRAWLDSDIPIAGRLFLEFIHGALGHRDLLEGRMRVAGRRVDLSQIRCPVLSIRGERDAVVPAAATSPLARAVGSRQTRQLSFPTGHLGLSIGLSAHARLWSAVGRWLAAPASADGWSIEPRRAISSVGQY